ncbi:MAG: hypothetical protein IIA90_06615 [Chloroflexi bacterium]|nr:hypothetical protein [Chloroflexota bacterium]
MVAAAAAVFLGVSLVSCGADRGSYVAANEMILASLSVPEGAEEKSRSSSPYWLTDQPGADGYTTNVVYTVAEGTTDEDILRFYVDTLGREWEHCRGEIPVIQLGAPGSPSPSPIGRMLSETFFRNGANVSVLAGNLSPMAYAGTFEVSIDHNAYRNFCSGEDLR